MKKLFFVLSFLFTLGITCTTFTSCSSDDEDLLPDKELKCAPSGGPELIKICGVKIDTKTKKAYVLTWTQPGYEITMISWGFGTSGRLGNYCDNRWWEMVTIADFDRLPPTISHDNSSTHKVYKFDWPEEDWNGGTYRFCVNGTNGSAWGYYTTELPAVLRDNDYTSVSFSTQVWHHGPRYYAYAPQITATLKLTSEGTQYTKTMDYGTMYNGEHRYGNCNFRVPYDRYFSGTLTISGNLGLHIHEYEINSITINNIENE